MINYATQGGIQRISTQYSRVLLQRGKGAKSHTRIQHSNTKIQKISTVLSSTLKGTVYSYTHIHLGHFFFLVTPPLALLPVGVVEAESVGRLALHTAAATLLDEVEPVELDRLIMFSNIY